MHKAYRTEKFINVDVNDIWQLISQKEFVKDFFPGIKKEINSTKEISNKNAISNVVGIGL